MGCCGSSTTVQGRPVSETTAIRKARNTKQSVLTPAPVINVTFGANVVKERPKVIFIFGGPGSHKGRVIASLQSMFGMKLVSSERLILKHLPKRVAHVMTLSSAGEVIELVHREPHQIPLDWVLQLIQNEVESDPQQMYLVDLVPSLKWLLRSKSLIRECASVLDNFEHKVPVSFALHLSLSEDSLTKTLDYSHHFSSLPLSSTIAVEVNNHRAKRRFEMHEMALQPFLSYFNSCNRVVTVDVSSGASEAIWDKVHEVFTSLHLQAWRPVDSVLVFAMEGLNVGGLDLTDVDMSVVRLCTITTHPDACMETLLGLLSEHIDKLADTTHYFVIDPSNTTLERASVGNFHKKAIVFSDIRGHGDSNEGCVNKFSIKLNKMTGYCRPYFKAVCSSDDETLLFPMSCDNDFCQQVALCMAEQHPSKQ